MGWFNVPNKIYGEYVLHSSLSPGPHPRPLSHAVGEGRKKALPSPLARSLGRGEEASGDTRTPGNLQASQGEGSRTGNRRVWLEADSVTLHRGNDLPH